MILVTARITCVPGQEDAFIAAATTVIAATRATEDGCLAYDCSRDIADPNQFVFVESFRDKIALGEHIGTDHYQAFSAAARTIIAEQVVQLHTVEKTRIL
jgi:quinol monooxygenase YgiN